MNTDANSVNDQSTLFFHSRHVGDVIHVETAKKQLHAKLQARSYNVKHKISYKIDTGANGNLLPIRVYQQFFPYVTQYQLEQSKKSQTCLEAYNGSEIKQVGACHLKLLFKKKSFDFTFYIVECETAFFGLQDIDRLGVISFHCDSILGQELTLIHATEGQQTYSKTGTYEQTGIMHNTHKTKCTTDLDQYLVDDGEKEYEMAQSKDFTQKMIKKYPNILTGIGKLDGTVKIDLPDGTVPFQAGPRGMAYALQKPLHEE